MLEAAVIAGITAAGATAVRCGVLPTPGLSAVVAEEGFAGGVMITASHNPAHDNGLKVLDGAGRKPSASHRSALEALLAGPLVLVDAPGDVMDFAEAGDVWLAAVRRRLPGGAWLKGTRIVIDAANGAARGRAAQLVRNLGAEVVAIGEGSGAQINEGCGAVHPALLSAAVREHAADAGIALDGDGDRVIVCDDAGRVLDGDALLWLLADGPVAVGTIMSNEGLARGLAARGTTLLRTPVGDAHVAAAMVASGARVGAETSGHVLFADGLPTGCGLLAGLRALAGGPHRLQARLEGYTPTVQVHGKRPRQPLDVLSPTMAQLEDAGCRVVARASGTEPIVRVMVEHADAARARAGLDRLLALLGETA
jgi:phosphoglucosamine mutase